MTPRVAAPAGPAVAREPMAAAARGLRACACACAFAFAFALACVLGLLVPASAAFARGDVAGQNAGTSDAARVTPAAAPGPSASPASPESSASPTPPAAAPDRAALDAAVGALWSALSNEPGRAADVRTLRRLFHANARVLGVDPRERDAQLRERSGADFVALFTEPSERGFHEREVRREVVQYGAFAHVLSVVESRTERNAARPDFTGINSLQWYWDGAQWRLVTLYYYVEDPRDPIPPG